MQCLMQGWSWQVADSGLKSGCEKTLNITSYQGNANQTYSEIHPIEWLELKRLIITSVGKNVEERELSYAAGGCVKCHSHLENSMAVTICSRNPLLSIYPRGIKMCLHKILFMNVHSCLIQKSQKNYKQPKCLSVKRSE